jgi:hypothetical protein
MTPFILKRKFSLPSQAGAERSQRLHLTEVEVRDYRRKLRPMQLLRDEDGGVRVKKQIKLG